MRSIFRIAGMIFILMLFIGQAYAQKAEMRTVRVRMCADETFRTVHPDWKTLLADRLNRVSLKYQEIAQLKFDLSEVVPWNPPKTAQDDMALANDLMAKMSTGKEDIVLGFTSLEPSSGEMKPEGFETGRSQFLGRYECIKYLSFFTPDQEAAVLMHELGHTFGLIHVSDRDSIMTPIMQIEPSFKLDVTNLAILKLTRNMTVGKGLSSLGGKALDQLAIKYKEAQTANPEDPSPASGLFFVARARLETGIALRRKGKLDEAADEFRAAIRTQSDFYPGHMELAGVLQKQGKSGEAEREYREAVRLRPDSESANTGLATVLSEQNRWEDAEKILRQALLVKPKSWMITLDLGLSLAKQKRYDEAVSVYQDAIRLSPASPEAYANLASALYDQGKYAEAWKQVKLARKNGGELPADFIKALSAQMPEPGDTP